jgi:capsid protein
MANPTDAGLIPLYTTQFSTNLELLLQQMGSKLRGKTREGFHVGKMASPINQIGSIALKAPSGRFSPKDRTDANFVRRWVFPQEGEIDQLIDAFDELQTIVDPKSQYAQNAANAVGRAWDDALIVAATGTAQIGQDANGLSSETFNTTNFQITATFGASAANGLTVAKLIEAKRVFRHYHNDLETDMLCAVIGSQQESDLLNQVQVVSTEFNDKPVLTDGRLTRFLGYDIVVSERLPQTTVNTTRGVLTFVKSGLYLGMWKDVTNRVSIRNDLSSEPWDLYTSVMYGASRLQPGKVVQILCADTTGADITP